MKDSLERQSVATLSPIVAILYFPCLSVCPFVCDSFFLSSCCNVFPTLENSESQFNSEKLVFCIQALLDLLQVRQDIYAIGSTAITIANKMQAITHNTSYQTTASIILIDRTLDLVAPLSHGDNTMDKIYGVLHSMRPTNNSLDVCVPLPKMNSLDGVPHGSIALDAIHGNIVESLVSKREKDSLNDTRKRLVEILTKEKMLKTLPKMGNVTRTQLESLMNTLCSEPEIFYNHLPFISTVQSIIETMRASDKRFWNQLQSVEKMLILSAEGDSSTLVKMLIEIVNQPIPGEVETRFSLKDILGLIIFCYSLIGDRGFKKEDEVALEESLIEVVMSSSLESCHWLGINTQSKIVVEKRVSEILIVVKFIGGVRQQLQQYKSIFKITSSNSWLYESLASQIAGHLTGDNELLDLKHVSSSASLGNLFKSGFSRFGFGKSTPSPRDNPLVIILFIGGIVCQEIKEMKEKLSAANISAIIGSTTLANSQHVLQMLVKN